MSNALSAAGQKAVNSYLAEEYFDAVELNNPVHQLFPVDRHGGLNITQVIKDGHITSVGADMTSAIAAAGSLKRSKFTVDWSGTMAVGKVPTNDIDLMGDNELSVVDALTDQTKDAMIAAAQRVEKNLCGVGYGVVFVISSHSGSSSPFTLTATNPSDLDDLQIGDVLVSASTQAATSLDTGSATVTAIDTSAGTVVVTTANSWAGGSNDAHFVFRSLDKISGDIGGVNNGLGLAFWLPRVAPSTDESSICGVNRSLNPDLYAGIREDARGKDLRLAVTAAGLRLSKKKNVRIDTLLCNPATLNVFLGLMGTGNYVRASQDERLTFGAEEIFFTIPGVPGKIRAVGAWAQPVDTVLLFDSSGYILHQPKDKLIYPDLKASKTGIIDDPASASVQMRMKALWGLVPCKPFAGAAILVA